MNIDAALQIGPYLLGLILFLAYVKSSIDPKKNSDNSPPTPGGP